MNHPIKKLNSRHKQQGLTTVEYAVAGGVITAAVVAAFVLLGGRVDTVIRAIVTALGG